MNEKEVKLFYDMTCLYEFVGELDFGDDEAIEQIQELFGNDEFNAINILYNKEGYETANEAFTECFGMGVETLNRLADECGYSKVGEA